VSASITPSPQEPSIAVYIPSNGDSSAQFTTNTFRSYLASEFTASLTKALARWRELVVVVVILLMMWYLYYLIGWSESNHTIADDPESDFTRRLFPVIS
jgi:hypothetical protein